MTARRLAVPAAFLVLLGVLVVRTVDAGGFGLGLRVDRATTTALRKAAPPKSPGSWPVSWISGTDCHNDPPMQVHAYNEDTYVIRQSKCATYEAPFLYLLFGEDKVLLMDTGATGVLPVKALVDEIIANWLAAKGQADIDLIVAHTHGHFDHVQADNQFAGSPDVTRFVGTNLAEVTSFWGLTNYPEDIVTYDLGGRVVDVLATPGHHPVSVSLYDRDTQILWTGDIVYPGHLFVFSASEWFDFRDSLQRLVDFAAANPVQWVVGCHIEMSATPFEPYAYTTTVHPDEHLLQFRPEILSDILEASLDMGNEPACTIFDEFVIHPVYLCGITWNG